MVKFNYEIKAELKDKSKPPRSFHTNDPDEVRPNFPPKGWGYVKAGWYSEKELTKLNLDPKDALETREVVVFPEVLKPLPKFKDIKYPDGTVITAAEQLESFSERYEIRDVHYVIPAQTVTEYRFDANYILEVMDLRGELSEREAAEQRRKDFVAGKDALLTRLKADSKITEDQKALYDFIFEFIVR